MKKFSKFYLIILIMLIIGGLLAQFFLSASEEDVQQAEQDAATSVPGYSTMLNIAQVTEEQQLQQAVINIEIAQQGDLNSAIIHMQSNAYMDEDVLLKDSYNILTRLAQLETLAEVTMIWYKPVNNKNEEALTFTLSKEAFTTLSAQTYKDIPTLATNYILN